MVVQFEVTTPAVSLSASSGVFGGSLSASGTGFAATESVELHVLKDPSSAPADCQAIIDDAGSEQLGSATASGGAATVSGISVDSSFVRGANNHLCMRGASSGASSPVVTFEAVPSISLSPASVSMGSVFSASGSGFDATESVALHLVASPGSAPADCDAVRNAAGSVNLGSANASGGSVTITGIGVDARFAEGPANYLCLRGTGSGAASAVVQLHVGAPTVEAVAFASAPAGGTYQHTDGVEIAVTFDHAVTVDTGQSIALRLVTGTYARAHAAAGAMSETQLFRYSVAAGDYAPTGIAVVGSGQRVHGRTVPGITVANADGVAFTVDYPSTARDAAQRVDARYNVTATAQIVSEPDDALTGAYGSGEQVRFRIDAPEGVSGTAAEHVMVIANVGGRSVRAELVEQTMTSWTFAFTVQPHHSDHNGVGLRQSVFQVTDSSGRTWSISVPRLASQRGHAIDGRRIDDICKILPQLPWCRPPNPPPPDPRPKPPVDPPPAAPPNTGPEPPKPQLPGLPPFTGPQPPRPGR